MSNGTRRRFALLSPVVLGCAWLVWAGAVAAAPPAPHTKPQTGKASYYGTREAGKRTASGAPMKPNSMMAASRTLPLGTTARVTNLENGKSVAVVVADRGPYAGNRILDVSTRAAEKLDMKDDGVAQVKVQPLSVPQKH